MAATLFMSCGLNNINKLSNQRFDPLSASFSTTATTWLPLSKGGMFLPPSNGSYLSSGNWASKSKRKFVVFSADQVADLLPIGMDHLPQDWPAWLPGVLLALVVPFFTYKWGPFGKFKAELDKVEEAVDNVADRVEEIAEKVEEFVGDIADDLPEGSQFRQTLEKVEMVADTIGKDAKMVSDMVDKMDEMEAKLETMLDKAAEKEKKTTTPTKLDQQ
ncbi:hypothetical protein M8C21_005350 [Ambrosia artemisiifolia]|uniref:Uncharacterized protein n=1 Tax=Ambrosia artemisiifolia TaxID=4212 RepID=A0AAD5CRP7_AMBAR|nr:hypothetical protein M8C21_005350 [Ambrosia artemisiifolia]